MIFCATNSISQHPLHKVGHLWTAQAPWLFYHVRDLKPAPDGESAGTELVGLSLVSTSGSFTGTTRPQWLAHRPDPSQLFHVLSCTSTCSNVAGHGRVYKCYGTCIILYCTILYLYIYIHCFLQYKFTSEFLFVLLSWTLEIEVL